MMLPNKRGSRYHVKWVFLNGKEGKESEYLKNYVHKIRARKEEKHRCGKPNETAEISWQRKILLITKY